jgi:carbon starvation protein
MILAMAKPDGTGALTLWPLFGASNQLLAGLALLVITVYLHTQKKPIIYTGIPMLFMVAMTGWSMIANSIDFFQARNWLLFIVNAIIVIFVLWMIVEVIRIVVRTPRHN